MREWVEGESLFFDDTFSHEVWNNSDKPRVCLLVDIWHPGLTALEREAITALGRVMAQFVDRGYTAPWSTNGRSIEHCPDARQWVWVRQRRTKDGGLPKVETRLFLTSIPSGQLSPEQMLTLVRRHWGIENGPNWTADVVLEEDTASPSLRGNAPLVLSWLRVLAYNVLALVRTHLPARDKRPPGFARTMEVLYQGLLGLAVLPEILATLA